MNDEDGKPATAYSSFILPPSSFKESAPVVFGSTTRGILVRAPTQSRKRPLYPIRRGFGQGEVGQGERMKAEG